MHVLNKFGRDTRTAQINNIKIWKWIRTQHEQKKKQRQTNFPKQLSVLLDGSHDNKKTKVR